MGSEIFKYPDTNSSRAEIEFLNRKFDGLKIAIIGLGGTGSYILDSVAKTPVQEIHLYDGDLFQLHNAFRAPGAISGKKLDEADSLKKVHYFHEVYSNMHCGIVPHDVYVTEDNIADFGRYDHVFVSVDKNEVRNMILRNLMELSVPFIDCGLGVKMLQDSLIGTVRITTGSSAKNNHVLTRIGSEEVGDNIYGTNIQIAELNSFNANLAVVKWKKMVGFYQDLKNENNSLFFISTTKIINEDFNA